MRRQFAMPALLAVTVLAPAPAFAQDSATPTATPTAAFAGTCDWTRSVTLSGPSPRSVVAGETVTFTATLTGPLENYADSMGSSYRWATPTSKAPAQVTSATSGIVNVAEGETATRTVTLRPTTNTRFVYNYGFRVPCNGMNVDAVNLDSAQVIDVSPNHTIDAVRNGPRDYTFSGTSARPGMVLNLYRVTATGSQVLTSQTRTKDDGTWTIDRRFTGSGRFGFLIRTGRDMANAPGVSRTRDTVIH